MKNRYRCDSCGCYLDPGEGMLCDECREETRRRISKMRTWSDLATEAEGGQYQMRLQEVT